MIPTNEKEFYAKYGKFTWTDDRMSVGLIMITDRKWQQKNLVMGKCPGRSSPICLHREVKQDLEGIKEEWDRLDHPYKLRYDGCYWPRHQMGKFTNPLSLHSWGVAVDFNSNTNRHGRGDLPKAFIDLFEKRGWDWGGNWEHPDPMHFQAYKGPSF